VAKVDRRDGPSWLRDDDEDDCDDRWGMKGKFTAAYRPIHNIFDKAESFYISIVDVGRRPFYWACEVAAVVVV